MNCAPNTKSAPPTCEMKSGMVWVGTLDISSGNSPDVRVLFRSKFVDFLLGHFSTINEAFVFVLQAFEPNEVKPKQRELGSQLHNFYEC